MLADARGSACVAIEDGDAEKIAEERESWHAMASSFLAPSGAGEEVEEPEKKFKKTYRQKTYEYLISLHNALACSVGRGLEHWRLAADASQRPHPREWDVLVLSADQGSDGYAAQFFMRYHAQMVVLFNRDDNHRRWNDCKLGIKDCGLWGLVILVAAALNGDHAPFGEAKWWQSGKEKIAEYMSLTSPHECPLFCALRGRIVQDRGLQGSEGEAGFDDALFSSLSEAWHRKTEKVGLCRWFHWREAVQSLMPDWTVRYLGDVYQCLTTGLEVKDLPTLSSRVKLSGHSDAQDVASGPTGAEHADLAALRRASRNTLQLRCAVFGDSGLQGMCRLLVAALAPFHRAHGQQNLKCRSRSEVLDWYWSQSSGGAFTPIADAAEMMRSADFLAECSLDLTSQQTNQLAGAEAQHPLVCYFSDLASLAGRLVLKLAWRHLNSAIWFLWSFPGSFAALAKESTAGRVLAFMRKLDGSRSAFEQQGGSTYRKLKLRSIFHDLFVQKVFCLAKENEWRWSEELGREVSRCFAGCGGTKPIEDGFKVLRSMESTKSGQNKLSSFGRMWKELLDSELLAKAHRYDPILQCGEESTVRSYRQRFSQNTFTPRVKASPPWLKEVMGANQTPKWFSTTPLNEPCQYIDMLSQIAYQESGRWECAAAQWLCLLVGGDLCMISHSSWNGQVYFALGHVSGRAVICLPAQELQGRGNAKFYALRTNITFESVKFAIVDDIDGWTSTTFRWLSPHESFVRKLPFSGLVAEGGEMRTILRTAALNGFWKLERNLLTMIMNQLGVALPEKSDRTLFALLYRLTEHALPELTPANIMDVLAVRAPKFDVLAEFFQTEEASEHIENLAGDDKKEVKDVKKDVTKEQQEAQIFTMAYKAKAKALGIARKPKKQSKASQARLKRGPMFDNTTRQDDVEFYLPNDGGYRVYQDNFNGRWLLSHKSRYIASYSWLRFGAQQSATLACDAAWHDHYLRTDERPPWQPAQAQGASGSSK